MELQELAKKYDGIACEENYHDDYPGELSKEEFPCLTYTRDLEDYPCLMFLPDIATIKS